MKQDQAGILYTAFSYLLWGILPIYWKWVNHVSADEILANRIFWSFWFMLLFLFVSKRWKEFTNYLKTSLTKKKQLFALLLASLLISTNWFIYIWAVNTNQMVEASLGYYINPLVSVLLGVFILKESLSKAQVISFGLAAIGVLILTLSYGEFPWIAIGLAFSFGLYGLAKKLIQVESSIGLTLETMTIAPISLIYLGYMWQEGTLSLFHVSVGTDLLLMGAGAATAIPLLFFSKGAQQIPLYMVGFLQYIAPTITLILGIFMYHEEFSVTHLVSFMFIWLALTVFTASRVQYARKRRRDARLSA
ncbi:MULTISPECIES: EamA family transporter RarD [Rossellomorea]|uniref:EamA family transporter RarD n=1 Tax=Rossellomorea vietnamensis TaxID=218284 RepID=A0A6I6UL04_9BACI|nr:MULTISPECIES: EamA family transporter RarD [Rossellomorea]OXS59457.1 EamA family transporter [Bacillus sp. DSM 27956]PRX75945.1 chloramphenicol-sensitive protein RarD [Bacillus sp. V-88]MCC5801694.1 EamA family transporter RarD [Rossellomorea vietnamensis]QHE62708.1 EamA family transporter RarD [Rossellomorea vietnamensis]WGG44800.1 EamA family transporter RarD [Rossellomorea sp. DA94]